MEQAAAVSKKGIIVAFINMGTHDADVQHDEALSGVCETMGNFCGEASLNDLVYEVEDGFLAKKTLVKNPTYMVKLIKEIKNPLNKATEKVMLSDRINNMLTTLKDSGINIVITGNLWFEQNPTVHSKEPLARVSAALVMLSDLALMYDRTRPETIKMINSKIPSEKIFGSKENNNEAV